MMDGVCSLFNEKWKKIIIDKSNKITKQNNVKNFNDYSKEMGGYVSNDNYKSKNLFFKKYLKDRYLTLDKYLTENLNINKKNLSIASGRAINKLSLISVNEYDYLTKIKRSLLINKIINYLPFTTKFF